jgi:hypothetical protein
LAELFGIAGGGGIAFLNLPFTVLLAGVAAVEDSSEEALGTRDVVMGAALRGFVLLVAGVWAAAGVAAKAAKIAAIANRLGTFMAGHLRCNDTKLKNDTNRLLSRNIRNPGRLTHARKPARQLSVSGKSLCLSSAT